MATVVDEAQTAALLDARYQLHERVGVGGMAEIYRAEDIVLGRTVAIKLMRSDAELLASPVRVQREADALAALSHPAVVTLLDARISGGDPRYLVMEYVDGPTLADLLGNGPLPPASVVKVAADVAGGLQAVHAANLVHRDVKPSNILLAPPSTPGARFDAKLADFGLAQVIGAPSVTTPGVVFGTAAYIAPEQARGELSGPPADIYAFGLVLLEALTGQRAFGEGSGPGVVVARLLDDPAIPDHIDPRWAQLIRAMTSAAPEDRPAAQEVVETLATLPVPVPRPVEVSADERRTMPLAVPAVPLPVPAPLPAVPAVPQSRVRHRPRRRVFSRPVVTLASVAAGFVCLLALIMGFANQGAATEATSPAVLQSVQPGVDPSHPPVAKATTAPQTAADVRPEARTGQQTTAETTSLTSGSGSVRDAAQTGKDSGPHAKTGHGQTTKGAAAKHTGHGKGHK